MSPVEVQCPGCGAPIEFQIGSSVVKVCEHCQSAVARGDRNPEDLGKVAAVIAAESPLQLGLAGEYREVPFEIVGRIQLAHPAGGTWTEWYLALADGRWGWLAEAQGHFYLTFRKRAKRIPPFAELALGQKVRVSATTPLLTVAERGRATIVAAEGEIPYRFTPGETYDYVDLSGPAGHFATIDYSGDGPTVYRGRELTLAELHLTPPEAERAVPAVQVEAVHLACTQCGGSIDLRAPQVSERVACAFCGALHDVSEGKFQFLRKAELGRVHPALVLGSVGRFEGVEYVIIGFLRRSVEIEGIWYHWDEYLLYERQAGFRWLVHSDRHWSFVRAVPVGSVTEGAKAARFEGKTFKIFQDAFAYTRIVLGEFYWKVEVGEKVRTTDYVHPPEILSREITEGEGSSEVTWSHGVYVPVAEVERAFKLSRPLRRPSSVAPNQPFAYGGIYPFWAAFAAVVVLLGLTLFATASRKPVYQDAFSLQTFPNEVEGQVLLGGPFALEGGDNVEIEARAAVDNAWLWIDGDLYNEETGVVQGFSIPLEYYHGVEGGESWSEGKQHRAVFLSALPAGNYSLRLEVHGDMRNPPLTLQLRIRQDVPRVLHWFVALLAVSIIPGAIAWYHRQFERKRWEESNV